jgi:hypothetical protein
MTEAIANHHEPDLVPGSLTSLIAVADSLAAALGYGTVELKEEVEPLDLIAPLGVDDRDAVRRKVEALPGRIADALAVICSHR